MRILLVEDEQNISKEIEAFLSQEGFLVDVGSNLFDAEDLMVANSYDFLLLDLGLPDGDGLELLPVAKKIHPDISIIILTARSEVNDRIQGLEKGADDYLPKPFSLLELKARMHAILRRKSGWNKDIVHLGGFELDVLNKSISHQGKEINLTKKELNLLVFLVVNKNRVLNRFQLAEHLWGDMLEADHQSNYIDVHIKNIRKKLGEFEPFDCLETVRGLGYKISI